MNKTRNDLKAKDSRDKPVSATSADVSLDISHLLQFMATTEDEGTDHTKAIL